MQDRKVAIAVPLFRSELTPEEAVSLKHLKRFLGRYDTYCVCSPGLTAAKRPEGYPVKHFDDAFFRSPSTYSRLLLSRDFYRAFEEYEYLHIYQLDSLVFSDRLEEWCLKGYDYVGAPWLKGEVKKEVGWDIERDSVGNGGFSLRRIAGFLKVFDGYHRIRGGEEGHIAYEYNEDMFWSLEAKKYYPDFRIPAVQVALSFAFELGPRICFERNQRTLPFGCHGWTKYDRKFWELHIL